MKTSIKQTHSNDLLSFVKGISHPLQAQEDLDLLLEDIGTSRFVLLGEASHGTHEYYTWRAQLSKRLITEKGFSMVAVEGDWPDCYRLNRYVKGYRDSGDSAAEVLRNFNRWPTWMWANWEIVSFAEWLRDHNTNNSMEDHEKVGFYGLDVYSLWESMEAIRDFLKEKDPASLDHVIRAMNCFEPFNIREGFSYAERHYGISASCEKELEALLSEIRRKMPVYKEDPEAAFSAEQNALVAMNAERYYKVMLSAGEATWNIRDRHMNDTINRLVDLYGDDAKIIIWEHNTHIGDARATDMKRSGLINVGQLVKEQHDREGVYRVGFGSYEGSVLAAYEWGQPVRQMQVPPARQGSWEHLLHDAEDAEDKFLLSRDMQHFRNAIGHRAIGVVYDPEYEFGNYVPSVIPTRYEAFIYLDKTQALHPLHVQTEFSQMPETYPWGV